MPEHILLTGGAGYVGINVALALILKGYVPIIYDNYSNSSPETVAKLQKLMSSSIISVTGDINNKQRLLSTLRKFEPSAVIHCAALKNVIESLQFPTRYYEVNVNGYITLLSSLHETGINNLVISSTANIYGEPAYLPICEQHPKIPKNPYGISKLTCEQLSASLAESSETMSITALRYFNPAGSDPSFTFGDTPLHKSSASLFPIIGNAILNDESITIYGSDFSTSDGYATRDFIHISDLAEGHIHALEFTKRNKGFRAFNLGLGRGHSVNEVLQTFSRTSGKKVKTEIVERRAHEVGACYADVTKANLELKWKAKLTLAEMVESAWQYYKISKFQL